MGNIITIEGEDIEYEYLAIQTEEDMTLYYYNILNGPAYGSTVGVESNDPVAVTATIIRSTNSFR